jgi:FG-GAP repeat
VTLVNGAAITINSPSPAPLGSFGSSIDSANGLLIVGAPYEPVNGVSVGQAWVFDAMTGSPIRTLVSPNIEREGLFGWSAELTRDLLIVGAPGETVNGAAGAGRVYIFSAETGSLVNTLVSANPQHNGFFGASVDQGNGLFTVGAPFERVNGLAGAGDVYVFNVNTGSLITTLISPKAESGGQFGTRVEISDARVIVGAPGESMNGFGLAGRAYVFVAATGSLISTLVTANAEVSGFFGDSVAMASQQAFVGADAETVNGLAAAGRIYVFNVTTGSLIRTLVSPDAQTEGRFGVSIGSENGRMIVGAPNERLNGVGAGRVYIFDTATGTLTHILVSPNAVDFGQFGFSVDFANGRVYVGAPGETVNGQLEAGSVHVFARIIGS